VGSNPTLSAISLNIQPSFGRYPTAHERPPETLENDMAARDRFSKKIVCPQCGHSGFAEASEDDDRNRKNPGFAIDVLPRGFYEQRATRYQESTILRCHCGRKFPFRAITEPAHS
jgi:hypothetical protein